MESGNLFFALMFKGNEVLEKTMGELKAIFGDIKARSSQYDFNFTGYYEEEFGENLKKIIIIFDKKINKDELAEIKIKTREIEVKSSMDKKRTINIDPGLVNSLEVILTSFKKKGFKECLECGVFLHKVLEFEDGKVKEFWHTFPDFKDKELQDFFLKL